jgi:hypothetical protein
MINIITEADLNNNPALAREIEIADRNKKIVEMRREGMTLEAIGKLCKPKPMTKEGVRQVLMSAWRNGVDISRRQACTNCNGYHLASAPDESLSSETHAWEAASEQDAKEQQ